MCSLPFWLRKRRGLLYELQKAIGTWEMYKYTESCVQDRWSVRWDSWMGNEYKEWPHTMIISIMANRDRQAQPVMGKPMGWNP